MERAANLFSALDTGEENEGLPPLEEPFSVSTAFGPPQLPEEKEHLVPPMPRTHLRLREKVGLHVGTSRKK